MIFLKKIFFIIQSFIKDCWDVYFFLYIFSYFLITSSCWAGLLYLVQLLVNTFFPVLFSESTLLFIQLSCGVISIVLFYVLTFQFDLIPPVLKKYECTSPNFNPNLICDCKLNSD